MIDCRLKIDASLVTADENAVKADFSKGEQFTFVARQDGLVALRHTASQVVYVADKATFEQMFDWSIKKEVPNEAN